MMLALRSQFQPIKKLVYSSAKEQTDFLTFTDLGEGGVCGDFVSFVF